MSLSIITPHYNDLTGLEKIYSCLQNQSHTTWEWIIVDDFSNKAVLEILNKWHLKLVDVRVRLFCNNKKTNASVCRNIGIDQASYNQLVFLDADDLILENFVANRLLDVEEFTVFKNYKIISKNNEIIFSKAFKSKPLDSFLKANFLWQTTCVLWDRTFLMKIGKFDPNLQRLQDVELFIRALIEGKNYKIIDNEVDFLYRAMPIRLKQDIVKRSCESVNYLILKITTNYHLEPYKFKYLKSYYFACTKNLQRSKSLEDIKYVKGSLKVFYTNNLINVYLYLMGSLLLTLYRYHMISDTYFLKINRYFFK
ncbi:glycosyltransferase family 2 protein [Mesoflavibacter zeaxanthinifaciens]